jgi:hypothetical protein
MDWKDWAIIGLVVVLVGGPLGLHIHRRAKGPAGKGPRETEGVIDDVRRLGETVAHYGGKAIAEGGKLIKRGGLRFNNERQGQQLVGGA